MGTTVRWVLSVVIAGSVFAACQPRASREGVLQTLGALQEAGLRRDVATLTELYSTDYFHTNPDGSLLPRDKVLAIYRSPATYTFSKSDTSELRMIERGDMAVVSERVALHGKTPEGDAFISSYRITYVLVLERGHWRVVNSHATLLDINKHPTG